MSDATADGAPAGPYAAALMRPPAPGPVARAVTRFMAVHASPLPLPLTAGVLGVGVTVAVLVVGHRPGLGLALAVPLMWVPAVPALVRRRAWSVLLTASLAVALGAVAAVRDAEWVVALSLLAAFALSAVAAAGARSPLGLALAVPTVPIAATRGVRWFARGLSAIVAGGRAEALRWVRTAALTLVILGVFAVLLASADAVFATLLPSLDLRSLPAQILVGAFAVMAALAIASLAQRRPPWSVVRMPRPEPRRRVEWYLPVLALDALMLAFLLTQVVAAAGGDRYVRQVIGLSYAAYARQGFGQLVAVTALTLAVVAWFARRAPRAERSDRIGTRAALGVLCVSALGIVATALFRMSLYVQAYGLTELRLLATAGEIVMGAAVVLVLVAGVRWRARWLPLAVVRVAGVAMLALALLNPDALMVRYNTQAQDAPLDAWHLEHLSADAVPAIAALDDPLRSCLLRGYSVPAATSIWEWNHARAQARAVDDVTNRTSCR
ncbi:DUF4153 domain-containing protein [Pseudactinotalea sp.]|uniref:DUF4153 domain-containing protein n=1 Tax=Pseudactinotalea sp. TaxID=1926260 RepID=UPI003B3BAA65